MPTEVLTGEMWIPALCEIGRTSSSVWALGKLEELLPHLCCSEVRTGPRGRSRGSPRTGIWGVGMP